MNEFVIRNKWLVFAAVVLAFAALAAIATRGSDQDVAISDPPPVVDTVSVRHDVATSNPNVSDDSDADSQADDEGDQTFASDDELIENPQGEDPSAGLDGDQAGNKADSAGDPPADNGNDNGNDNGVASSHSGDN